MNPGLAKLLSLAALGARLLCALSLLCMGVAQADFAPQILIVRGDGVAAPTGEDAADALRTVGDVAPDEHYLTTAREQGIDPTGEEGLQTLAPAEYTTLIVVLQNSDGGLHVEYRDGHSGLILRTTDLPLRRRHLDRAAQALLSQGAQLAMDQMHGGAPAPSQAAPQVAVRPSNLGAEPAAEPPEEPALDDSDAAASDDVEAGGVGATIAVGFGVGTRDVALPSGTGLRTLKTGLFPAVDLALHAEGALSSSWLFGVRFHYQTSVFATASETPAGGVYKDSSLRSHHVELGVEPALRFSKSKQGVTLGLFAGWMFRGMRTVVDMSLPGYTLHGPVARMELRVPLSDGEVVFRVAPEVAAVASVSKDLRVAGDMQGSGLGFGGEAELSARATDWLRISGLYRESHLAAPTSWSASFTDVERFFTVQGVLQY